jgi:hypothetical protein
MKNLPPTADTLDRLAKAIMEKHAVGYDEASATLAAFRLNLVCDESIAHSTSLQAGLLTAVNTGKRAFHGGVSVCLPQNISCRIPWPGRPKLNDLVVELGGQLGEPIHTNTTHTVYFGNADAPVKDSLKIVCSGWRGGVVPADLPFSWETTQSCDFALSGVLAGVLGVARGFLRVSGLGHRDVEAPIGVSLWRPDLDFLSSEAEGPMLEFLPKRLWFLGLGHLGQAFIWNLGLLPFQSSSSVNLLLQDFDEAIPANWGSGLLCNDVSVGRRKTRLCAEWLERRGFKTTVEERAFDENTKRSGEEPFVALCGFDSEKARSLLTDAGFDLIVECGLGADANRFDKILLHTFPDANRTPSEIWSRHHRTAPKAPQHLIDAFEPAGGCGILGETLAGMAVSSSFVGAFAGALAVAEVLRALHGGVRCELISGQLRSNDGLNVRTRVENYVGRVARNGFVSVMR